MISVTVVDRISEGVKVSWRYCLMAGLQRRLYTFLHVTMRCATVDVFAIPNFKSLGPKVNVKCQREVKLQLGSLKGRSALKMLQVGQASSWSTRSAW